MLEVIMIVGALVGVACGIVARQLGRDQRRWFWAGASASIVAFLAALWYQRRQR